MILVFGGAYQGKRDFALKKLAPEIQGAPDNQATPENGTTENGTTIEEKDILDVPKLCMMALDKNDQDLNYAVDAIVTEHARGAKLIYGLDTYIRMMVERGLDSDKWIADFIKDAGKTSGPSDGDNPKGAGENNLLPIVIMNDVSQGLVPMDADERAFREANGRALIKLAEAADRVYRVFLGIENRIK